MSKWISVVQDLLAIPCCHVTGMHDPNHLGKYVCESQKAAAYDHIVSVLKLNPKGLNDLNTYRTEPGCYWCKNYPPDPKEPL